MGTVNGSHGVMAPLILLPRFQRMYLPAYGKEGTGELAVWRPIDATHFGVDDGLAAQRRGGEAAPEAVLRVAVCAAVFLRLGRRRKGSRLHSQSGAESKRTIPAESAACTAASSCSGGPERLESGPQPMMMSSGVTPPGRGRSTTVPLEPDHSMERESPAEAGSAARWLRRAARRCIVSRSVWSKSPTPRTL